MPEQVRHGSRYHVLRPSIMEVYNKISEEEARARAKAEHERDLYAKRWSSGYELLAEMHSRDARVRMPENAHLMPQRDDESLHESDIDLPLQTKLRKSVSFSTSPPYSPPRAESNPTGFSAYPMESSIYPLEKTASRKLKLRPSVSMSELDTVMSQSQQSPQLAPGQNSHIKASDHESMTAKELIPADQEMQDELWKMIQLLKQVLRGPRPDDIRTPENESFRQMVRLIKPQHANHVFAPQDGELTDASSMNLHFEKISLDDAEYAQRLDNIRQRLGLLVTGFQDDKNHTSVAHSPVQASWMRKGLQIIRQNASASKALSACILIILTAVVVLRWLRFRAEYLWQYSYHDALYPTLHPLPSYVSAFLSPIVDYDTPFLALQIKHSI